ncbi:DUF3014 domain-containing protein [Curvibacter delicatus]|uniref:DUF3014 domain-containing protein n=1 Tax=Curvibacter delicatus TaxID=80879 RepID=UPI00082A3ADB|nr:DUF3014 domain-containing protein [Curvibacter delicatus]
MNKSRVVLVLILVAGVLGAAYFGWMRPSEVAPEPAEPPVPVPAAAPAPAPVASQPAIQYPLPAAEPEAQPKQPLPALADSDAYVQAVLTDLLGKKNVLTFLQLDSFARRVVATVDNLAREHAPPMVWPVNPTPGRFSTRGQAGSETIHPDNSQRYTPFVLFVESVDTAQAVRLYVSLYPLFQQAYEEVGFPKRYFNDRLVAVIDQLLAAPVQDGPVGVGLVDVKGPVPSERPWVRYEFTDPKLEALSAGQKMLIRTGPVNHRRLRAKLLEVRKLVTGAAVAPALAASAPRP